MFVSIVVILYFSRYSIALSEECQTADYHGTCQRLQECPYAMYILQHNGRPDICEFEGLDSIVCCLNYASQPIHQRPQRRPNQRPEPRPDNLNDVAFNLRKFLENVIPGLSSGNLPFGSDDSRLPIIFPGPFGSNDFSTARSVTSGTNQSNNYQVTNANLENVQNGIPISQKKCLKYYPVPRFPSFVTGGKTSLPKQYPHMALIGFGDETDKQWLCGGSLISKKFVLTAAHCLYSKQYGNPKWVHLGDLDLSTDKDDASPQNLNIIRIIPYPDFKPPQKYHDIALIELDEEVEFSAYVSPACLQSTKEINDTSMTATGWGKTEFSGDGSTFLMQVDLAAVGAEQCRKTYGSDSIYLPKGIVDQMQICAGGVKGKDTCGGDSGGPLQIKNVYRSFIIRVHTIVGITSFGKACGLAPTPGVYTRVSYYSKWIESIVWADDQD